MRKVMISGILALACFGLYADAYILPFKVKVGGQESKPGEIFARVANPVANDALLEVEADEAMIIVNVFSSDAEGNTSGVAKIIMIQGKKSTKLDQTMDKSKLEPGTYLMNIVAGGATARVLFTVK
ncbi:MAG: hypothetical protein JW808_04660 [Victivallales bacterium]|nr:hypothetical protein [Victivallales bacterium]